MLNPWSGKRDLAGEAACYAPRMKRAFSGDRLRERREATGLSQVQLAERSGVHKQTIASIEQGARLNPQISTLVDLADAMELSVDDFLVRGKRAR